MIKQRHKSEHFRAQILPIIFRRHKPVTLRKQTYRRMLVNGLLHRALSVLLNVAKNRYDTRIICRPCTRSIRPKGWKL